MAIPNASSLPNEIYLSIFAHLSVIDLLAVSLVCEKWHASFISFLFSNLFIKSPRQFILLNKYHLLKRHSHLIRSLTLFKVHLSSQDKQLLLTTCKKLNKLTFIKCYNLDSDFLKDIIKLNKNSIESFNIWGERNVNNTRSEFSSTEINDELLSPMMEFCGNLRELRICGAEITDNILISLTSSLDDHEFPADNFNSDESAFDSSQDLLVTPPSSPISTYTYPHLHSLDLSEYLEILGTKKDNVSVIKHENEMNDLEILYSFGIGSPFMA
ncbi:3579_t:CDS:2 [Cetraspora pellucida]|uniref:3579_t:CDS:1 n=1 Tax=Cetraspora pellucida TaxID=1433469 RepID=A0A9N9ICT8_9GLOM|nr:3579_t:CDS:2 [Cetraspora pellucida]